jgi:hypothetical protein
MSAARFKPMAIGFVSCGFGILIGAIFSANMWMFAIAPSFIAMGVCFWLKARSGG